jgi:hypothetical protein
MYPLIEDYTQIVYMIDKEDIKFIECKTRLRVYEKLHA